MYDSILSDWVSFLAYPNLFEIKGFVVVVVVVYVELNLLQNFVAAAGLDSLKQSFD
jgi:hypothetical protein